MTPKYLTPEETDRLFRVITDPRDRAIFRVAYHRGLRAREVAKLQLEDYRSERGRLFVHRLKCRRLDTSGEYALTDAEQRAIRAWIKIRGTQPGALFTSNRGTGISQQMLDVLIKRYCLQARIPADKAHMHVLSHSCATHLLDLGHGIEDVQDHLGHASITSTTIYARITNKRREESARKLKGWT